MSSLEFVVEIVGHLITILVFSSIAAYMVFRRSVLRRTTRRASMVYWLVILVSLFFAVVNVVGMFYLRRHSDIRFLAMGDLFSESPSVIAQGLLILVIISFKVVAEKKGKLKRVLAIGAHPDDIEIACGGTLAKMHDAGYLIRGIVMACGEKGGDPNVRPIEAHKGASFLGLDQVQVFHFMDTRLQEQSQEILTVIENAILDFQPDIILTHSHHDQHQDHQAVHDATLRAARNKSTILCYESPSTTNDFIPSLFVDIGDYIDVKIESIREHWDQRGKPYVQQERVRGVALFRGGQAKIRAAEGFEVIRALSTSLGEV